ncbi:MAG: phosphoenolpyruvate--protein phosphotransferase [Oscillospiraceae bacterium]|nr:phosphoenolpyruvate--protein phosphotransferase [Oscillospiraceae bacterium]
MFTVKGIPASDGYAIGKVLIKLEVKISKQDNSEVNTESELEKLNKSLAISKAQLQSLYEKACIEVGEKNAAIFESHITFLDDPEFIGEIERSIRENNITAISSIESVTNGFVAIFESMEDEYMRERAADIKDVSIRIIKNILDIKQEFIISKENTVVVAHDLSPSDTAQMDKSKIIGFVTDIGGKTSHTAIMARTLELPAIVGTTNATEFVKDDDTIIVDGIKGEAFIDPPEDLIDEYIIKQKLYKEEKEKLKSLKNLSLSYKDNRKILLAGNIGEPNDVDKVLENGGEAIGLFRTEFLYMNRDSMPTEDEQFEAYKAVLTKMENRPVVIRTLDIGGDKQLPYLEMPQEMNPFLGYRAIRLCLDKTYIFKTQLRALLRASLYGNLAIMFPMISSLDQVEKAKSILDECKNELQNENKEFNSKIEVGIMVEIPSSALIAEEIAPHVDFFSIGTNDLTQYTLAVDRGNENISYLYDSMHPAVLKLIKMTIDAAHKYGKWCGMCGELAGDPAAIETLVSYELDEFSMSASSILKAKKKIFEILDK